MRILFRIHWKVPKFKNIDDKINGFHITRDRFLRFGSGALVGIVGAKNLSPFCLGNP